MANGQIEIGLVGMHQLLLTVTFSCYVMLVDELPSHTDAGIAYILLNY
jgi:hypothetical protein